MNIDPLELAKHFDGLSDEELIDCCSSGNLTEDAQSIADKELTSRNLRIPTPVTLQNESIPDEGDLVTIAKFLNPTKAYIVRSCIENAGIPAYVVDANLVQTNSLWAIAMGGVRILIPATRAAEAMAVIQAFNLGELALRDDEIPPE